MSKIHDDKKWNAVIHNDSHFDGMFFYAVKSTGIYCKPSCKSKLPKRENVTFYATSEEAQNAGYRACKRCRSDLVSYEPLQDIALKLKNMLDVTFLERQKVESELRNIGLSQRRVIDIFKDTYGLTPKAYIDKLKIEETKNLLCNTDDSIIDIAYAVDFNSLSAFYTFFKERTGLTPSNYRKEHKK